jgi:recombination protein RecA
VHRRAAQYGATRLRQEMQDKGLAREFLRENPELSLEIENKVRESLGIPLRGEAEEAAGEQ